MRHEVQRRRHLREHLTVSSAVRGSEGVDWQCLQRSTMLARAAGVCHEVQQKHHLKSATGMPHPQHLGLLAGVRFWSSMPCHKSAVDAQGAQKLPDPQPHHALACTPQTACLHAGVHWRWQRMLRLRHARKTGGPRTPLSRQDGNVYAAPSSS